MNKPIQDVQLRPMQIPADCSAMAELTNRELQALGLQLLVSPEGLENLYTHLTNNDQVIVEHNQTMLAYARMDWSDELDGLRNYWFKLCIAPEWWGQGIESMLLKYVYNRACEWSQAHPTAQPEVLTTLVEAPAEQLIHVLDSFEYQPIRYVFDMVRDLAHPIPEPELPPGIEIRPATPDQYRQIWDADAEAFRDHPGFYELGEEDYQAWLGSKQFQPELWQVAWQGDQVVGMVQNYIRHNDNATFNRQRGYTEGISTRQPWRKQGIASALIAHSMHMFKQLGMTEAALGVDASSPTGALNVYKRLGFQVEYTNMVYRRPL